MSQQHTPLSSPKRYALYMSTLYEGCMGPAVVSGCLCGRASRPAWPLVQLVSRPSRIESMNCLPLLSRDEIDKWRLKVLNDDFKEKVLLDFEFEIFEMIQIRTFIQTCCEFLKIHLNQFETSNYC